MELTDDFIQSLAYPEYYERGEEYYRHGRVIGLLEKDGLVTATVHGSHDYLVTVDKNDLEMHCNCPAYSRKSVCKHVIAVLLTIISGETKPNRQNTLKGARKNRQDKTSRTPWRWTKYPAFQIKSSSSRWLEPAPPPRPME